jgi:ribose/xylose/arabinose/galactoside ABC-type transport system permease subunit
MSNVTAPARPPAPPDQPRRSSVLVQLARRREPPLVVVTLAIFLITTGLKPSFGSGGNISFLLADAMPLAILAVGQTVVCLVRGIDLSVAPTLGIAAVATGFLAQDYQSSVLLMLPLALAIGLGLGLVNGLFVTYARIPPIIATLGTFTVYGGVQELICNTRTVVTVPSSYVTLGNRNLVGDIPYLLIPGVVVTAAMALILWRTKWGRAIYAVGNNAEAAFRAGIRANAVLISAYAVCGALAGLAGLAFLVHYDSAGYTTGSETNLQLTSIAAALIGGTTLLGGKGGVVGSFLAALFLEVVTEAVIVAGIPFVWQYAAVGVLLLAAILIDAYQSSGRRSLRGAIGELMTRGRGLRPEGRTS